MIPRIYADFHDLDDNNCLRLTKQGTQMDLERLGIELVDGLAATFYMDDADVAGNPDDIMVDGIVHFSEDEQCWVGKVDWDDVYHASDLADNNIRVDFTQPSVPSAKTGTYD